MVLTPDDLAMFCQERESVPVYRCRGRREKNDAGTSLSVDAEPGAETAGSAVVPCDSTSAKFKGDPCRADAGTPPQLCDRIECCDSGCGFIKEGRSESCHISDGGPDTTRWAEGFARPRLLRSPSPTPPHEDIVAQLFRPCGDVGVRKTEQTCEAAVQELGVRCAGGGSDGVAEKLIPQVGIASAGCACINGARLREQLAHALAIGICSMPPEGDGASQRMGGSWQAG